MGRVANPRKAYRDLMRLSGSLAEMIRLTPSRRQIITSDSLWSSSRAALGADTKHSNKLRRGELIIDGRPMLWKYSFECKYFRKWRNQIFKYSSTARAHASAPHNPLIMIPTLKLTAPNKFPLLHERQSNYSTINMCFGCFSTPKLQRQLQKH